MRWRHKLPSEAAHDRPGDAALAKMAFDLAKRELDGQAAVLAQARTRAAGYVTASFAMAVFVGPIVFHGDLHLTTEILCGLQVALLLTAVLAAVAVTNPSRSRATDDEVVGPFRFALGAQWVLSRHARDATDAHATIAVDLEALYDNNQPLIEAALTALRISGNGVIAQLAVWGAMILVEEVLT